MKKVYIIILHYGLLGITKSCVTSLKKKESSYTKLVIINNNYGPLSKKDFPENDIIIINNNRNLGFAGGINIGIEYSLKQDADYILILNNDTRIDKQFLKALITILGSDKSIGIAAPAIRFSKNRKSIFDIGGKIHMLFGRTSHEEIFSLSNLPVQKVAYVSGAAMLIRKEVFQEIGLFDTQFFLYYEDVDFCLRAIEKGFGSVVVPQVTIFHSLSKTIGKVSPLAVYYQTQSAVLFGRKYMRGFPNKILHIGFLIAQTSLITFKHPLAGIAGWKALLIT